MGYLFSKIFLYGVLVLAFVSAHASASQKLTNDPMFLSENSVQAWWSTSNVMIRHVPKSAAQSSASFGLCAMSQNLTSNPWDAIIGLDHVRLKKGVRYELDVALFYAGQASAKIIVQEGIDPWAAQFELPFSGQNETQGFIRSFVAERDIENAQLVVQFGGDALPQELCLQKMSFQSDDVAPSNMSADQFAIMVNQLGYLPKGPKRANLVHSSDKAQSWQLIDQAGNAVRRGMTRPDGFDPSSGLQTHIIDFSTYGEIGDHYRLVVDHIQSQPFKIDPTIYQNLSVDAGSYFYLVRSGAEILKDVVGAQFARPAGHLGRGRNRGDIDVGCVDGAQSKTIYGDVWSCDYRLDVSGGWYDAGDFGKYVVNGGISVAQMMASYERAVYFSGGNSPLLTQNYLRLAQDGSVLPDILQEAKWELDFLLKMQVPEGKPLAGMAHHKVHGVSWGGSPMWPHRDRIERVLHRPSTAATLNLAAAAAQAARLFAPYDPDYAQRLLNAAIVAYRAAKDNPALYAPLTDGSHGGGDYFDDDVSDEFYWAAAELFISTELDDYYRDLKQSRFWESGVFPSEGISWRFVAGFARLQLALTQNKLNPDDRLMVQKSVIQAADNFIDFQKNEAFGLAYPAYNGLGWGSNHSVLQNMIVLAGAYDLLKDETYLNAARESMDYILGRNALGISYVTGYGSLYARHQHARIFGFELDKYFPPVPFGALAGGPNSDLSDDYARKVLTGCAPQACYVDDHRSFSTNEIAINWNAALLWVASFLDDTKAR